MAQQFFKAEVVLLRHLQMSGAFSICIDLNLNYHIVKEDLRQCIYNLTTEVQRSIQAQTSLILPLETKGIFLKKITIDEYDATRGKWGRTFRQPGDIIYPYKPISVDWKPMFRWEADDTPLVMDDPNLIWNLYQRKRGR